jgi:hypothetical protein
MAYLSARLGDTKVTNAGLKDVKELKGDPGP